MFKPIYIWKVPLFGEVMKVESVKPQIKTGIGKMPQKQHNPNFTALLPTISKTVEINMNDEVKNFMPPIIKGMKKISDNMGEVQNIIINALGTGLVAPIFIKWNPLSKTDEDTRTYSAWRQPVSAVLAVVTQVGVTIPFNRMITRLANNGYYDEKYNKTLFQDKEYIEKNLKRLYPHETNAKINDMVKQKMAEQQANLLRMIKEDKVMMSRDDGNTFQMSEKAYRKLQNDVIKKRLKDANDELTKCTETTIPKKLKRAEYYRTHKDEALKIFKDLSEKLNKTDSAKTFQKDIKKLKKQYKNADSELLAIFDDILDRRGNNQQDLKTALDAKLKGILRDIKFYTDEPTVTSKETLKDFITQWETRERINPINEEIKILEEIQNKISAKTPTKDIENYLAERINDNPQHRLFKFKFSKEVSKLLQERIKNNLKAHKQLTGLRVSLLILPVSCWLLNWIYPRFMDAVFPNLSNKKHPNEIKSLVNKANHKEEVKS